MTTRRTGQPATQLAAPQGPEEPLTLSPKLLRARVACHQAQAHYDALSKDPAAVLWAEIMDDLWAWVSSETNL